jgi:hypothetical protein
MSATKLTFPRFKDLLFEKFGGPKKTVADFFSESKEKKKELKNLSEECPEKTFSFARVKKFFKKSKDRSCNDTVCGLSNLLTLLSSTMCLEKS